MKANHNKDKKIDKFRGVVAYPSKNTNWKRITTEGVFFGRKKRLLLILLKIQIESESQQERQSFIICLVVAYPSKNTNWKRITTLSFLKEEQQGLLLILLKIQIESESQPAVPVCLRLTVVAYPSKNTNWKRITTICSMYHFFVRLLLILLKIQIESESQRTLTFTG